MRRVHWLQHVEHETLGGIAPWLRERGLRVSRTRLYAGEPLPTARALARNVDWLIVMGGPMNVYQHRRHPWLAAEKAFINDAVVKNKAVLGFCLGAQLVADVLGGRVVRNRVREIGFFDVRTAPDSDIYGHFAGVASTFTALHWHGDRFEIPPGGRRIHESDACVNQSFSWGPRVLGLQYHLEVRAGDLRGWLRQETPRRSRWVQSARRILAQRMHFTANARALRRVLQNFSQRTA